VAKARNFICSIVYVYSFWNENKGMEIPFTDKMGPQVSTPSPLWPTPESRSFPSAISSLLPGGELAVERSDLRPATGITEASALLSPSPLDRITSSSWIRTSRSRRSGGGRGTAASERGLGLAAATVRRRRSRSCVLQRWRSGFGRGQAEGSDLGAAVHCRLHTVNCSAFYSIKDLL
jgi:hypothetical protein